MKILLLTSLLFSLNAFAEVPTINAASVTCEKLNEELATYKNLIVVKKTLGIKSTKYIQAGANCDSDQHAVQMHFNTINKRRCKAGFICRNDVQIDVSYSESSSDSSYDSGYSSGSSSSSDSGSSSSSSSSDHGPSYNPPSSSDHGPSYNPPSSGERGSRYCPSC